MSIQSVFRHGLVRMRLVIVLLLLLMVIASPAAIVAQEGETTVAASFTANGIPTLVGPDGRTLYWLAHDHEGEATCTDVCAEEWPPLIVDEGTEPTAGDGISGQIGTVAREDGALQVTYNGWPLYFYHEDEAPGDANGQGEQDVWFAMPPAHVMLSQDGTYLVGSGGLTLYVFTQDEEDESYCFGECAVAWPPYTLPDDATPLAGAGLTGALATTIRDDGGVQLTYNGWPLYYFKGDLEPGDRTGDGLKDVWFVANPDELEVGMEPAAAGGDTGNAEATTAAPDDSSTDMTAEAPGETGGAPAPQAPASTPEAGS